MKIQTIMEIAEDAIMAELCVKYYNEKDEEKRKLIYNEILEFHKVIKENENKSY